MLASVTESARRSLEVPLQPWAGLSNFFGHLAPLLIGIPLSLVGSTLSVCGLLLQKASHQQTSGEENRKEVSKDVSDRAFDVYHWLDKQFLAGLALYGLGGLLGFVALGIAPNTVLACLNCWSIVMGPVMASWWFGEHFSHSAMASAFVLVVGCTWVACLGPRSYRLDSVEAINCLFAQIPFTICCITCGTVVGAALLHYYYWCKRSLWSPATVCLVSAAAAIFATYSVLFAKCTSIILQATLTDKRAFPFEYQFYMWAAGTVLCGPVGLYFLNESLRHGDAAFVIPVYQSLGTIFQLVVGGVLFREYAEFGLGKHLAFWPGVLLVIVSVGAFTRTAEREGGALERRGLFAYRRQ